MAKMTPLRRRMIDDMTVRNLSLATQQSYIWAVARFSWFFRKSPDQLGVEEVRTYQLELIRRGLSSAHINQVSAALRFVFGVTLGRPEAVERIVIAKMPKRLPIVLSREEVAHLLHGASGLRNKAALATAYGTGLRAAELATLKVADIDSQRMVIRVEHGKGGKSLPSRKRGTATSCFRRSCSPSCAPTGGRPGPATGSFLGKAPIARSAPNGCRSPVAPRGVRQV